MSDLDAVEYYGSCHCGAVKFKILAPAELSIIQCNCSICFVSGYLHLHIKRKNFTLLSGADQLISYRFNTKQACHTFCKTCGIKPFYNPRSHPEDYSINVRCLNIPDNKISRVTQFNGKSWEENISSFPKQPVNEQS